MYGETSGSKWLLSTILTNKIVIKNNCCHPIYFVGLQGVTCGLIYFSYKIVFSYKYGIESIPKDLQLGQYSG